MKKTIKQLVQEQEKQSLTKEPADRKTYNTDNYTDRNSNKRITRSSNHN